MARASFRTGQLRPPVLLKERLEGPPLIFHTGRAGRRSRGIVSICIGASALPLGPVLLPFDPEVSDTDGGHAPRSPQAGECLPSRFQRAEGSVWSLRAARVEHCGKEWRSEVGFSERR